MSARLAASDETALWVVATGVACALHVGKLPPAIPVLQADLGLSLVQAGFLLSLVQLAGMCLGLVAGSLADRLGPRRVMLAGLVLLSMASAAGALAASVHGLLLTRAFEGLGFLLAVLPAPGVIRRVVGEPAALSRLLGLWGAYMPAGSALALLLMPLVHAAVGWRVGWVLLALLGLYMAWQLARRVPLAVDRPIEGADGRRPAVLRSAQRTLSAGGPWLVALAFFMYSGQWLAVVGFLPTIYTQSGWPAGAVAFASAVAAGANIIGNVAAGRLLARRVPPGWLLAGSYLTMALAALLTFAWAGPAPWRFVAVVVFSAVGGLIPGTLFSLAVRLAPDAETVSTSVGWVQQWSSLGQFLGPPLVAALAAATGGWHWTWLLNAGCGLGGLLLAWQLQRRWRGAVPAAAPAGGGR